MHSFELVALVLTGVLLLAGVLTARNVRRYLRGRAVEVRPRLRHSGAAGTNRPRPGPEDGLEALGQCLAEAWRILEEIGEVSRQSYVGRLREARLLGARRQAGVAELARCVTEAVSLLQDLDPGFEAPEVDETEFGELLEVLREVECAYRRQSGSTSGADTLSTATLPLARSGDGTPKEG